MLSPLTTWAHLWKGNLQQLFSPNGIPWHHAMVKQYGRVFKFHGFFGVSGYALPICNLESATDTVPACYFSRTSNSMSQMPERFTILLSRINTYMRSWLVFLSQSESSIIMNTHNYTSGGTNCFSEKAFCPHWVIVRIESNERKLIKDLGDHHKKQRKLLNPGRRIDASVPAIYSELSGLQCSQLHIFAIFCQYSMISRVRYFHTNASFFGLEETYLWCAVGSECSS